MRFVHGLAAVFILLHTSTLPAQDVDPNVHKWLQQLGTREEVRFQALNELIKLGEKSIQPTRQVLNDRNEPFSRRWQAAKVLGALKANAAVPDLVAVVEEDDNVVVKRVAAESLGKIGDRSVLPPLKRALEEERDLYVRPAIEQAVKALEDG